MTKRLVIILFALTLLLAFLPGKENRGSLYFSSGVFSSSMGATWEKGRFQIGGEIESGFPNLFVISTIQNPEEVWGNLKGSLTLFYGGNASVGFDLIPSERHDLILGASLSALYTDIFNYSLLLSNLSAKAKYQYNTKGGTGIFLETRIPLLSYSLDLDEKKGNFSYLDGEGLFALSAIFYTRLGLSVAL